MAFLAKQNRKANNAISETNSFEERLHQIHQDKLNQLPKQDKDPQVDDELLFKSLSKQISEKVCLSCLYSYYDMTS